MFLTETRALQAARAASVAEAQDSRAPSAAARRESSDDGFDFPPTLHPGRELFTASLFVLMLIALLVWGGSKLISLLI
jgi:hypothetical protein